MSAWLSLPVRSSDYRWHPSIDSKFTLTRLEAGKLVLPYLVFVIRIFTCQSIAALFCVTTNSSDWTYTSLSSLLFLSIPLLPSFFIHPLFFSSSLPPLLFSSFLLLPSPISSSFSSFLLFPPPPPPSRSEPSFPPELSAGKCQCFTLLI